MTFYGLACYALAKIRFPGFVPQPITLRSVNNWLSQFGDSKHKLLFTLLWHVQFVGREATRTALSTLNRGLLEHLAQAGIPPNRVVYIQTDEAGSSSPVMLNMLRDADRLQSLGCTLIDSKNEAKLLEVTYAMEEGAIVYVDDFAGSAKQFCESRDFVAQQIVGKFVEFLLVPYICEEALDKLERRGIEYRALQVHRKTERFLHPASKTSPGPIRGEITRLSAQVDKIQALGYKNLGTMIVFAHNCPNTTPAILRGNRRQYPFVGILPGIRDLPPIL